MDKNKVLKMDNPIYNDYKRWCIEILPQYYPKLIGIGYDFNIPLSEYTELKDLPDEQWQPILNYEDLYLISNYNRIKSINKKENSYQDKILLQYFYKIGYLYIVFFGKKIKIHRIVGLQYLGKPIGKRVIINHKNAIKWDNRIENLEWVTMGENQIHARELGLMPPKFGFDNKMSVPIIQYSINGKFLKEWGSMREAARHLDIDKAPIGKCCSGNINYTQAYNFIWRFSNNVYVKGIDLDMTNITIRNTPKFFKRRITANLAKENKLIELKLLERNR